MMLGSLLKDFFRGRGAQMPAKTDVVLDFPEIRQQEGGTILCFAAESEGDALKELIYWSAMPLKHLASDILVVDLRKEGEYAKLPSLLKKPVWFAMSHLGIGEDIYIFRHGEQVNLWAYYGVPFLRLYGDHPAYFPVSHLRLSHSSINNYADHTQADFYKRWLKNPAICVVLPPIVFDPLPLEKIDLIGKSAGKIVFVKNGNAPDRLVSYWRNSLPSSISACLESVAEECTSKAQINRVPMLDDQIITYYKNISIDLEAEPMMVCFMAAQIDDYMRRVKSTMIGKAIVDLPVVIRGRFWDHLDFQGKRATLDTDTDYFRTAPVIDQAPAIIDMSPNTLATPHDRICRAAGRGTAFLTNQQDFLDIFDRPDRFSFDFEIESIRACVEHFVANPQEAIELGLEQARIFRNAYPEKDYAETLRSILQLCAFRLGERPPGTQNFVGFPYELP